jgi:hypothetical protein
MACPGISAFVYQTSEELFDCPAAFAPPAQLHNPEEQKAEEG